ncbi:hypothetical protein K438DRAFT_1934076 [Mycena galopus ATCC 62051]|nr:hypothetical protein K438DRAFT_1934076 [Mycena galopus ATCC 62051]
MRVEFSADKGDVREGLAADKGDVGVGSSANKGNVQVRLFTDKGDVLTQLPADTDVTHQARRGAKRGMGWARDGRATPTQSNEINLTNGFVECHTQGDCCLASVTRDSPLNGYVKRPPSSKNSESPDYAPIYLVCFCVSGQSTMFDTFFNPNHYSSSATLASNLGLLGYTEDAALADQWIHLMKPSTATSPSCLVHPAWYTTLPLSARPASSPATYPFCIGERSIALVDIHIGTIAVNSTLQILRRAYASLYRGLEANRNYLFDSVVGGARHERRAGLGVVPLQRVGKEEDKKFLKAAPAWNLEVEGRSGWTGRTQGQLASGPRRRWICGNGGAGVSGKDGEEGMPSIAPPMDTERQRNGRSRGRRPDRHGMQMHFLVDPLHRMSMKVGVAVYHDGYAIDVVRARTSRCTRALLFVPVPTAVLILILNGPAPQAHRTSAYAGCGGAAVQTNERAVRSDTRLSIASQSAGARRVASRPGRERGRVTRGGAGAGGGESEIRVGAVRVREEFAVDLRMSRSLTTLRMHPKLDAPDVALPRLFAYRRGRLRAASPPCYDASVSAVASRYARGSYSRTAALDYGDSSLRRRLLPSPRRSAAHGARISGYDVPPLVPVARRSHILPPLRHLQAFRRRCGLGWTPFSMSRFLVPRIVASGLLTRVIHRGPRVPPRLRSAGDSGMLLRDRAQRTIVSCDHQTDASPYLWISARTRSEGCATNTSAVSQQWASSRHYRLALNACEKPYLLLRFRHEHYRSVGARIRFSSLLVQVRQLRPPLFAADLFHCLCRSAGSMPGEVARVGGDWVALRSPSFADGFLSSFRLNFLCSVDSVD